jgi:acyl-CoA synthetase (AMP-forming)/AMP-acid ligase II
MHSGDIAIQDEDGFYFIVDRTKDMIIRGGYKVFSSRSGRINAPSSCHINRGGGRDSG